MKVVLAPDSFKESVGAVEAAEALEMGVKDVDPTITCVRVPMSDGGEGFTEAICANLNAKREKVPVVDALGRPTHGEFAFGRDSAVLEVASAIGLGKVANADRDIRAATSVGVGQLIRAAVDGGAKRLLIGLGGCATSDAGAGMLAELGVRFQDGDGHDLEPSPRALTALERVDWTGLDPRLEDVTIEVACDVTNPLTGANGAAAIFGPQKGASAADVEFLDDNAHRLVAAVNRGRNGSRELAEAPGAGAAGGLGWALLVLGAQLRPGVQIVAEAVGLDQLVAGADLVITGEGSVDAQTLSGKTAAGVAQVAARHGVGCVIVAGNVAADADVLLAHGVDALVPIVPGVVTLDDALADGAVNLRRTAATIIRLLRLWDRRER